MVTAVEDLVSAGCDAMSGRAAVSRLPWSAAGPTPAPGAEFDRH